jgi:hypothetical protein
MTCVQLRAPTGDLVSQLEDAPLLERDVAGPQVLEAVAAAHADFWNPTEIMPSG